MCTTMPSHEGEDTKASYTFTESRVTKRRKTKNIEYMRSVQLPVVELHHSICQCSVFLSSDDPNKHTYNCDNRPVAERFFCRVKFVFEDFR